MTRKNLYAKESAAPGTVTAEYRFNQFIEEHSPLGEVQQVDAVAHKLGERDEGLQLFPGDTDFGWVRGSSDNLEQTLHLLEGKDLSPVLLLQFRPLLLDLGELDAHAFGIRIFHSYRIVTQFRADEILEKFEGAFPFLFEGGPGGDALVHVEPGQVHLQEFIKESAHRKSAYSNLESVRLEFALVTVSRHIEIMAEKMVRAGSRAAGPRYLHRYSAEGESDEKVRDGIPVSGRDAFGVGQN